MRAQSHNLLDVTPRISPLNDGSIHPLRPVNNVFSLLFLSTMIEKERKNMQLKTRKSQR